MSKQIELNKDALAGRRHRSPDAPFWRWVLLAGLLALVAGGLVLYTLGGAL